MNLLDRLFGKPKRDDVQEEHANAGRKLSEAERMTRELAERVRRIEADILVQRPPGGRA